MPRRRLLLWLSLAILALTATPAVADRAHDLAQKAQEIQPARCMSMNASKTCHGKYPAGCSRGSTPSYDAYLDFLKNQLPEPELSTQDVPLLGVQEFEELEGKMPRALGRRNHADQAPALAEMGEGNIYAVIGYLYYAKVSPGERSKEGETSNCQLTGEKNSDYHIGIGFDPDLAQLLRQGMGVSRRVLLQTSIIVEMTPHYRARYQPVWSIQHLVKAVGRQVKVIGQLMLDNEHVIPVQNCGRQDANLRTCWRKSAWEIHPVTEFYVCTTETPCSSDSNDWKPLAQIE